MIGLKPKFIRSEILLAGRLFRYYQIMKFSRLSRYAQREIQQWSEVSETDRLYFLRAARTCKQNKRSASDYVTGLFWWFGKFDRKRNNRESYWIPQPRQLYGPKAKEKLKLYDENRESAEFRVMPDRAIHKGFAREKRKLKSLSEILCLDPKDVLIAMPREFSEGFLRKQGVCDRISPEAMSTDE